MTMSKLTFILITSNQCPLPATLIVAKPIMVTEADTFVLNQLARSLNKEDPLLSHFATVFDEDTRHVLIFSKAPGHDKFELLSTRQQIPYFELL